LCRRYTYRLTLPSLPALSVEQLALLLELGLVDLALGETLIENVEGGAIVARLVYACRMATILTSDGTKSWK
jgi:hypothetical protein